MKKIVINNCYGGFGLSHKAVQMYFEIKGQPIFRDQDKDTGEYFTTYYTDPEMKKYWGDSSLERDDPVLVQVVEELGEAADGFCANLSIVEIPDGIAWQIEEYDGNEWIAEQHQTWGL